METFMDCKKVELHCHLDGSVPVRVLEEIADTAGIPIPKGEALKEAVGVSPDNDSLENYLKCFDLPLLLLKERGSLRKAAKAVLEAAARENVLYMELRFAPLPLESTAYSAREIVEDALEGLKDGFKEYGIRSNLILCAMRHIDAEENLRLVRLGREYLGQGVCALDVAGGEALFPIGLQKVFLEEARRVDMPFVIHAGECGDPNSIRNALSFGAMRIGHGIAAYKDPALLKELKERRIPLEICPISNMQTKAARCAVEYPFPLFYEQGMNLSINTDNRTVSGTSLTGEFAFLQQHYHITGEDVQKLTLNAVDAAFASEDVKEILWKQITGQEG